MKKLMFAAAVAAIGTAFAVESANVVGYNTSGITGGKNNMIGVPFIGCDGEGWKLNECLNAANLTGGADQDSGDQIKIFNPSTGLYEIWCYYDVGDEWTGWYDIGTYSFYFEDETYGHPDGLTPGTAFWLKAQAGSSAATFSGQLATTSYVDVPIYRGKNNMFTSPFPVRLKLDDASQVSWANATGGADQDSGDQIKIFNPSTGLYEIWCYYNVGDEYTGWYDIGTYSFYFEDETYGHPNGLDIGKGFWYKALGSGNTTFRFSTPVAD